jgi:hypothetical protein
MKKQVVVLLLAVCFCSLVSASYGCSDDSTISSEKQSLKIGDSKTIDRLPILLMNAQSYYNGKILAELNIKGKKISLSESGPTQDIKIANEDYNITLLNLTDYTAQIDISGSSEEVEEFETETINGLDVYLENVGESSADLFVGVEAISLSTDTELTAIYSENETREYLIELTAVYPDYALITVYNCNTGEVVEIEGPPVINTTQNTSIMNSTNSTIQNSTIQNQTATNQTTINQTSNSSATLNETVNQNLGGTNGFRLQRIHYILLAIVIVLILAAIILFILPKRKKSETQSIEKNKIESIDSFGGTEIIKHG